MMGYDCFGYGLVIPHYGTIVVGEYNRIGNYAVLQSSTCISNRKITIGNGLYLATGAKIITGDDLKDGITVAANSVVTKGCVQGYALLVGCPAIMKISRKIWYEHENGSHIERVKMIEELKHTINNV